MNYQRLVRLFIAITLLPLAVAGCSSKDSSEQQDKIHDYLDRAENYRQQGQYRAAIIEVRNALQQNPQERTATLKLAAILNELGQGKPASKLLEQHENNATRDEAIAIAQAKLLQHKYRSAIDYLSANEQRLNLANDADANLIRARAHLGLGNLDDAAALLAKLDNSNVDVALEKLRLLQQQGQAQAVETALNRLLQEHPDNVNVLSEAALQAERNGKLSDAEDLLSKALMNLAQTDFLVPQKAGILERLVSTLTKLGRSNEALVYAKTLADANPAATLLQDKFKQGVELFQAGKLDEAEPLLTEVYGESKNETAGMLLGMIRYAKKDLSGAAEYLGKNIDPEVAPEAALTTLAITQLQLAQPKKLLSLFSAKDREHIKSPELKMLVGIALLQTGSTVEGEKLVKSAQADQPDNPALQATLARHYLASAQPQQAVAILEPAVKARSDSNLSRLLIAAHALSGNPDKALATARDLANSTPSKSENWWVLGRTALQLQKPDVAESALRKSLAQQPDFLPAELDLARLYLSRKQSTQAEAVYRSILKKQPDQLDATKGLLIALLQRDAQPEAIESELLSTANADTARAVLAEYYLRTQKLDDADRQLTAISKDDSATYPRQLQLQLILMRAAQALQTQELEKARGIIAKGLELNPHSQELLIFLARLDIQTKNIASAKKIASQLAQTQPQPPQVLELLGDIAMQEGEAAAPQHYRAAWNKVATEGIAFKLYQSLAKNPNATNQFVEEWIQRLPNSPNAHFFRGMHKQESGNSKGAIADYETTLAHNPKDARALNNLAWLYSEQGDRRALATAEQAYALQPENPAILDTYGWVLVQSGQVKRGIEHLQAALKLAPDSKEISQHLSEATKKK